MFDIGFFELCLLFVVALVVLGPHRLPRVAREIGLWVGHIQRWVASIRQEINRELDQEDFGQLQKDVTESVVSQKELTEFISSEEASERTS